jgi:hypothetical protein
MTEVDVSQYEEQFDEEELEEEVEVDPDKPLDPGEAASALETMLSSSPHDTPEEKREIKRLGFAVTMRGVGERQVDMIGKRSERPPTKAERARGVIGNQRDAAKFNLLLVTEGMVDPDLTNRDLLGKFGPRPEDVVRNWFLPGEIVALADAVMDLSGYGEEAVTRAKK